MTDKISKAKSVPLDLIIQDFGIQSYNNKIICPFHQNDSNPSLMIYPSTNTFYCWGCNTFGDNISFVEKYLKVSFNKAIDFILKSNHEVSKIDFATKYQKQISNSRKKKDVDKTYRYFFDNLTLTKEGKKYLTETRKINNRLISKYKLKSIDNYGAISKNLLNTFGINRLLSDGLMSISKTTGKLYFTFFIPSVIIPHILDDKYVYAISRSYQGKSYLKPNNIPARVFVPNIHSRKFVIVESIFCGLSYEQLTGNDNYIAISSLNIRAIEKLLLTFKSREITLMLDNDDVAPQTIQNLLQLGYKFNSVNPQDFAKDFGVYEHVKDINDILVLLSSS